jgi:uncharacterized protein YecT (DUF1311 family)
MQCVSPEIFRLPLFLAAALPVAVAAIAVLPARAAPLDADVATIEACLSLTQKNREARGPDQPDKQTKKARPEGWLKAARDAAPSRAESCIQVVATPCLEGARSTAAEVQCYDRETSVWDAKLNAAYQKLLAKGDDEEAAEGFRKTQQAWITFRDASCIQAWLVFKGTMAAPMQAYCRMEKTAQQALWLERWVE